MSGISYAVCSAPYASVFTMSFQILLFPTSVMRCKWWRRRLMAKSMICHVTTAQSKTSNAGLRISRTRWHASWIKRSSTRSSNKSLFPHSNESNCCMAVPMVGSHGQLALWLVKTTGSKQPDCCVEKLKIRIQWLLCAKKAQIQSGAAQKQ